MLPGRTIVGGRTDRGGRCPYHNLPGLVSILVSRPVSSRPEGDLINLFVVAFGQDREAQRRLVAELSRTAQLYPLLDPTTGWAEELPGGVLVAAISNAPKVAAPRVYAHRDPRRIVLYDGLPLDPSGRIRAHDAAVIDAEWDSLPDVLEGRFVALRAERDGSGIEMITDPTGIAQVYAHERAGAALISNSADLIARAFGLVEPDPVGVATFLTLDWVAGNRTLRKGVDVVPGAQHWRWRAGDREWRKRTYWSLADVARSPTRTADSEVVAGVVDDIARISTAAAAVNGTANAPLTGGKDSRLLAAVLMTRGVPVEYWTKGDRSSLDATIAAEIARTYGLPHRFANRPTQAAADVQEPTEAIASHWSTLSETFVAQTDGIASLMNIGNIQGQPDRVERIQVTLTGLCAELARGSWEYPALFGVDDLRRSRAYLVGQKVDHRRGLVTADAFRIARSHVGGTLDTLHAAGVPVPNLGKAFYAVDKCRRWAPMNPRELSQTEDKVLPFMTRQFVAAALSLQPEVRWRSTLHQRVIADLVPGLETNPPLALPWPGEPPRRGRMEGTRDRIRPLLPYTVRRTAARLRDRIRPPVVYRSPTVPYDESAWIETNLSDVREVIMSQSSSPLWSFVDRGLMGRLLAARTSPDERRLNEFALFAALTMFEHDRLERSSAPVEALARLGGFGV